MAFTAAFIAHAPDGDPARHRSVMDTGMYKLFSVVARTLEQAVEVCRRLVQEEGVHSIILCPGHSHADVAAIQVAVGPRVSVWVARGDPAGNRVAVEVMGREGWLK